MPANRGNEEGGLEILVLHLGFFFFFLSLSTSDSLSFSDSLSLSVYLSLFLSLLCVSLRVVTALVCVIGDGDMGWYEAWQGPAA